MRPGVSGIRTRSSLLAGMTRWLVSSLPNGISALVPVLLWAVV
ncbi:hypothetical protein [Spirosoma endophyticum]|nr:hypothetical protein [Spirosoma endophyticum]